jgi:hypothetical protein
MAIPAMDDYSDCYAALGVSPDVDWKTLRAQYKRLIGKWHPDRFSADIGRKEIAEERSKRITLAYRALEKYRRDHGGVLPRVEPVPAAVDAQRPTRNAEPTPVRATRAEMHTTGATVGERAKRRPGRAYRVAIVLSALTVALYLARGYLDASAPIDKQPADIVSAPDVAPQAPLLGDAPSESHGILHGSTLGEVYAIQGVPTLTERNTWHYGKSQIHFARGKVISWDEHPDNPLRIAPVQSGIGLDPSGIASDQSVPLRHRHFDVGSTKDEVRAIQGPPVTETDTVWDYAPSRVYFERNRVVRWEESPMQPLRVAH